MGGPARPVRGSWAAALVAGAALLTPPVGVAAQSVPNGAVPNGAAPNGTAPGAEALYRSAAEYRTRQEERVVQYSAVVRRRIGAGLRTFLKDRTLFRSESAHRVFWNREGDVLVQVLARRTQTPAGVERPDAGDLGGEDPYFDPMNDQLFFGMVDTEDGMGHDGDDFWLEHPLEPYYRDHYAFRIGDTLTLSLPDGRSIEAVELQVLPTVADVHRITGSLWIEPGSGAVVRAVYRLADGFDAFRDIPDLREEEDEDLKYIPGMFKPWTAEVEVVAVDYSLWDFDVWMPRRMRAEIVVSAGILTAPGAIEYSYDLESVVTEDDLARASPDVQERRVGTRAEAMDLLASMTVGAEPYSLLPRVTTRTQGGTRRRVRYLVPDDPDYLLRSPDLPPPIWEDAPGFVTDEDLAEYTDVLADLPMPPVQGIPYTFRWGHQRADLLRYNRVEGLSVGARGQIRPQTPFGPLSVSLTARVGAADRVPNVRLDVVREGLERRMTVSGYHELAAVDDDARHLGLGNSVTALLFGRDDGDYYRRAGAAVSWSPPAAARPTWLVRAYTEHHRPANAETDFSLWTLGRDAVAFRPNLEAARGWETGGLVRVSPWWGSDPRMAQGGLDLTAQGAGGDWRYVRATAEGRLAVPLVQDVRFGLEAGAGTAWGDPPLQRLWRMGGAGSLRGYPPGILVGPEYLRARAEVARTFSAGALTLFADAGWAGERGAFRQDDVLYAVGAGVSVVDGLIRFDAAWGLKAPRDFRLELYLDGIL